MARTGLFALFLLAVACSSPVTAHFGPLPSLALCSPCVSLMNQALQQLINAIMNVGVVGGCGSLCKLLPNSLEAAGCNLICDYVGIEVFVKILQEADLDPIYYCQLIELCPHVNGGAAHILSAGVSPPSGPVGTQFAIGTVFEVTQLTGTGVVDVTIYPPRGEVLSGSALNEGFKVGEHGLTFNVDSGQKDQNGEPLFQAGQYHAIVQICEGQCGALHAWSGLLAKANTNFTVTQQ